MGATKQDKNAPRYIAVNTTELPEPWPEDAERAVLSECLTHPEHIDLVDLKPLDFHHPVHQLVWSVMRDLRDAGLKVDITTVVTELKARERWHAVGDGELQGLSWISALIDSTPAVANVQSHVQIVRDYSSRRAIIRAAQGVVGDGYKQQHRGQEFALWASAVIEQACSGAVPASVSFTMREAAKGRRAALQEQWNGKRSPWGLRGPLRMLNVLSHGMKLGSFSILAGLTSSGKTVLAQQEAECIAGSSFTFDDGNGGTERADCGVLYLSLEMPRDLLIDRHVCRYASVTQVELQTGRCADGDGKATKTPLPAATVQRIDDAFISAESQHILYVTGGHDAASVRSWVKRAKAHFRRETIRRGKRDEQNRIVPIRLALVVIDHVHLMDENDEKEVVLALGRVAKVLKRIAVDDQVHVRALAQFNRDTAKRGEGGLPQIHDIKYASALEQAADQIHLVHRPYLMFADRSSVEAQEVKNEARIIIGKGRDGGQLGHVECLFIGEYSRFEEERDASW
jgi:replicative DNA helicase